MRLQFQVGDTQRHEIEYSFSQLRGRLVIRVNRQEVFRRVRMFNEPRLERHFVRVDKNGELDVLIEKVRKPLFGHQYRVFLNGRLYRFYAGSTGRPDGEFRKPGLKERVLAVLTKLAELGAQRIVLLEAPKPL